MIYGKNDGPDRLQSVAVDGLGKNDQPCFWLKTDPEIVTRREGAYDEEK